MLLSSAKKGQTPYKTFIMYGFVVWCLGALVGAEPTWSNATMQETFMRRAITLAKHAKAAGGAPYGALIADPTQAKVLAEGRNHVQNNPIWHGEMDSIDQLSRLINGSVVDVAGGLELYTTAEPCPMCMGAIAWSGFGRVYFGTSIPFIMSQNQSQINIRAADIVAATSFRDIIVSGGLLHEETDLLYSNTNIGTHGHQHDEHGKHAHEHEYSSFYRNSEGDGNRPAQAAAALPRRLRRVNSEVPGSGLGTDTDM
jgi:tRNA(Arg) A34 adenosine deaminase TadA